VDVYWTTASEQNSAWFDVERKEATGGFTTVATIPAAGTSTNVLNYGIKDADVERGRVYVYRLKSVDKDGKYSYSIEVEVAVGGLSGMEISDAIVTPYSGTSSVNYSITSDGTVELGLYDMMGRRVQTLDNGYRESGIHTVEVNSSDLSSGLYQLVLKVDSETAVGTIRVVK
ncbi:MAG: T9SS type A sorting domain-containing protein, partial [Ignavibacteriae bacterium]|nr:T9SS type A sorting domain-containing protein [Ignavibacteriota bacterium]